MPTAATPARRIDSNTRFVAARLAELHAAANDAALTLQTHTAPTLVPPANDAPTVADLLEASVAIADAIERIRVVACHSLPHGMRDVCDEPLPTRCCAGDHEDDYRECVLAYALEVRSAECACHEVVYALTLEAAAYELLARYHPTGDQSGATRDRVIAMIERSFASARGAL